MIIKPVVNPDEIKYVVGSDYDAITSDEDPALEDYHPSLDVWDYMGGYVDGDIVGIIASKSVDEGTVCHIMTIPSQRQYAGILARKFLKGCNGHVFTIIPETHQHVIRFAEKFGFQQVATNTGAWVKNGLKYNAIVMRWKE